MINKSYIYYGNVLFENSNSIDTYYIDFVFLMKLKNKYPNYLKVSKYIDFCII